MPFVDVDGAELYYEEFGQGSPVLLITGFSGDTTFFKTLIPELVDEHRVIVYDNRGAGRTVYPGGPIDSQDLVDDAFALFERLELGRAHVLGWSMGGHIAQELAIQHPECLRSLTLVSAYPYRPARSSYFMNGMCDCALAGASTEYISMMTNAFCFTESQFSGLEAKGRTMRSLTNLNAEGCKAQMHALDRFDTREKLHLIRAPTLSVHGLSDIMVEPMLGDYISDRIPGCKVLRIENMGHIVKTALYAQEFKKHIAEND